MSPTRLLLAARARATHRDGYAMQGIEPTSLPFGFTGITRRAKIGYPAQGRQCGSKPLFMLYAWNQVQEPVRLIRSSGLTGKRRLRFVRGASDPGFIIKNPLYIFGYSVPAKCIRSWVVSVTGSCVAMELVSQRLFVGRRN